LRLAVGFDHAHYDEGAFDTPPNPYAKNPDRSNLSANFSTILGNGDDATAEVSHSDISVSAMAPQIAALVNTRLQTDSVKATYSADTFFGRITASGFYTSQTIPGAETQSGGFFNLHDHTVDGKIEDLFKAGPEDSLRFDLEYRYEIVHTSDTDGSLGTAMIVGSAMWDHQFGHDWTLVNAVRYYRNDSTSTIPMPMTGSTDIDYGFAYNASLIYKLDADDSLRATASRGIALPSQLDFETLGLGPIIGQKVALSNDPNLSRSPSQEYRLSWDHQLRDVDALARISLFTKQSTNAMDLIPLQVLAVYTPACAYPVGPYAALCSSWTNSSEMSGVFDGAELQIDHKSSDGWRWGANYSIEQLHPHAAASSVLLVPDLKQDQLFQKANANVGYGWSQWTADLRAFYSSPVRGLVLETVGNAGATLATQKAIVSLSPHLSWRLRDNLSVDLAADNLWAYRENLVQRVPATYFLSVHFTY
jgi:outer membrane receptor protein involved in Fe transport